MFNRFSDTEGGWWPDDGLCRGLVRLFLRCFEGMYCRRLQGDIVFQDNTELIRKKCYVCCRFIGK